PQRAAAKMRQELIDDLVDLPAPRQHRNDHLGFRTLREVAHQVAAMLAGMALRLLTGAIPDEDVVLFCEVTGHGETHGAKTDECQLHGGAFDRRRADELRYYNFRW